MEDIRLMTENELKQLRCDAIELEDMRIYKKVVNEINRRFMNDD